MLRIDWLSHLKTRRPNRRRKTGRKPIRNSAELLQIRTMLSANPIATISEDESGEDESGEDESGEDDSGDDDSGTGGDQDSGSCGAHMDNPTFAGEHCAAMALATPEGASHTLIASGDWSDASVWQDGVAPTEGADVYIPAGMTLTVDGVIAETLHTIRIDGTLRFATDVETQLKVDTIVGAPGSLLEIGTEANPIAADVTARIIFADGGEIDRTWDPSQISRGAILHGQTVMFGAEKTAWTTLTEPARAGGSTLTLGEVPVGWRVGDELVIAGTDPNDPASDETVTIASIDGSTVTLSQALQRDHVSPAADLSVHVANNTRNILLSSENAELMRRGHVMFMHTLNVDVNFAGFYQLGRTDKSRTVDDYSFNDLDATQISYGPGTNVRGRYSVHFHRGGTDPTQTPARVRGAVVAGNPGWGYVNHSANVDFISNVAYDVTGSAFNNEAGDELGSYVGNIALRIINPNDPLNSDNEFDPDARESAQDFGFQGDGFWLQGAGTRLEKNVVAGNTGTAFFYWPEGLLEPGLGQMQIDATDLPGGELLAGREDQQINTWWNPVAGFQNNTAYGVGVGLNVIYLHTTYLAGDDDISAEYLDQLHSTFDGLTGWNIRHVGLQVDYTARVTFSNVRLHGFGDEDTIGVSANQYQNQKTLNFDNFTVEGFGIGMATPPQGDVTISGTFSNLIDFDIENPQRTQRTMNFNDIVFGELSGAFDEGLVADRTIFVLTANFEVNDDKHSAFFLLPDRINLNFGDFAGQALYFNEQHPDFVPMPSQPEDSESVMIAPEFLGKTNQQLFDEFGLSFGGALLPGDATSDSELALGNALIGMAADPPTTFPPGGFPENEEDEESPEDEEPGDDEDEEPGDDEDEEPGDDEDEEPDDEEPGDDESPDSVTISLPAGASHVTIVDGHLVVSQNGEAVSEASLAGVTTLTLRGTSEADAIILDLRNGADLNLESISVLAGDGDDTVTFLGVSGSSEIAINGESGNDLLIGSAGDEVIAGGEGHDTMIGGAGRDDLSGGAGNDVLIGNGGHDTLDGGEGDDFARGDSGHDDITAGSGADVLLGRAGNDTLRFSPGIDSADGGAGSNVMLDDATSSDTAPEVGGTNVEIAIPNSGAAVSLSIQNGSLVVSQGGTVERRIMLDATETLTITGSAGDDEIGIDFSRPGAVQLTSLTIDGEAGNDEITIEGLAATLADSVLASGGVGDDVITFNRDIRQAVTVDGGAGHDSITTARGRDIIRGGDGNDFIDGGAQRDFIKGDRGHDRIFGRGGSDRIYGGSGFDTINGNGGNDLILGNSGNDFLKGATGNDRILGHGGNDVLRGDAGDDTLQAGDGEDVLLGNAGNDALSAGAGNDLVFGHNGNDSLAGGEGDDTCSGHNGDDIVMGQAGDDLITGHGGNDILAGGDGTDEVTGSESEIDEDFTFLADWIDTV